MQERMDPTPLAGFISGRFKKWKENRKPVEAKYQRNLDAFNSVSTGFWKSGEAEDWRSSTFFNITKVKIIAAFSLVSDMLLQGGKIPFDIVPSPWSNITLDDLDDESRARVDEAIEDQHKHIDQQLQDCGAEKSLLKNIMAGAMYGETYSKRTVQQVERRYYKAVSMAPEGVQDQTGEYTRYEMLVDRFDSPSWDYLSVWDVFRDLESDDLQAGAGVIHRDHWSAYDMRQAKDKPLYIAEEIDKVLSECGKDSEESDGKRDLPPGLREVEHRHRNIEVIEFWGRAPRKAVERFEEEVLGGKERGPSADLENDDDKGDDVEIMAVLAGGNVIRFLRTEPGNRPIYRTVWEECLDSVCGTGIADNLEDVQLVLNGAIRGFEDNKRLAGDVMLAAKSRLIDGTPSFKPGKTFDIAEECEDVRQALQQIVIQDVGEGYVSIIGMFDRFADIVSMIPQISQGVRPDKSADTAYELSQMLENAGKYLGGVIRNYDNGQIEPIITSFYRYNMMDPDAPGKGDFSIRAQGFSSFQAHIVRVQKLMRLLTLLISDPQLAAEGKVREHLKEIYKAEDVDPDVFLKSREEKEEDQAEAMDAQAKQLEVAQALKEQDAAMQAEAEEGKAQRDHERDMEKEAMKQANGLIQKVMG